jgi:8-oxo-dGTP pyrophosphatase MutT (NUDIX family)
MYQNILETLAKYGGSFPNDKDLPVFLNFLQHPENKNEKATDRKNFNGHITVSALVVKGDKVLLLWHKTFNRLQQPGGHIDPPDENVFGAVIREVKEETGLDVDRDHSFANGVFAEVPICLDKHQIAKNDKKQEESHYHYDMFFLLKLKDDSQEIKNEDEGVEDAQWVKIEEINESSNPTTFKAVTKYKNITSL